MRKGFTLIELLVVVLIMGILASVAMPQYFKSVEKSRAAEGIAALTAIVSAQERYYMKKGTYAEKLSDLDVGIGNLNYFTVTYVNGASTVRPYSALGMRVARMTRLTDALGGGLSRYNITLRFPAVPGSGPKVWNCYKESTTIPCDWLLPQ